MLRHLSRTLLIAGLGLLAVAAVAAESRGKGEAPKPEAIKTDYILLPSDLIKVQVFEEEGLNREVRISQESTVNLPLIGSVDVSGNTARQAEEKIRALYERDYLVHPQVNLIVVEYVPRNVFVFGSVLVPIKAILRYWCSC